MARLHQHFRQPATDQPTAAQHENAHGSIRRSDRKAVRRALAWRVLTSGSLASVVSTVVASLAGHRATRSLASASNATSHWVWGEPAKHRHRPDFAHTAVGYAIHHASSLLWAGLYELACHRTRVAPEVLAPSVAALALLVDYQIVPSRLTPGFERHLSRPAVLGAYVAFAAALLVATRIRQYRARRHADRNRQLGRHALNPPPVSAPGRSGRDPR